MPKKNALGAVLLTLGLLLSGSIYTTLWIIKPSSLFEVVTISMHDTYLTLHPVFILTGVYSVVLNLFIVVLQSFKRFRFNTWNIAHLFALLLISGFVYYGREVLRFGFAFLGRRLDVPDQDWTLNHSITYTPGRFEKLSQNIPEAFLLLCVLCIVVLSIRVFRLRKTAS